MAKIFANQVRIYRGPSNNQKPVLAIFDANNKLLWEAPRMPVNTFEKIGSTETYQYNFNTEECKFDTDRYILNHKFDHTKLIPQPCNGASSVWVAGTVEINSSTMTFTPWNASGTYNYTIPYGMQSFKPAAVWLADKWYYSDSGTQYEYNYANNTFDVATHLDTEGNPFVPDPSQMWMRNGVLHQGNDYKYIYVNNVGWRWASSGIQTISGFTAASIWTDGDDIFYGTDRILNKNTLEWDSFTMNVQVSSQSIWTDGRYLYANMTYVSGAPNTYLKWNRFEKKWVEISTTKLIYTINSMNYLWTDRKSQDGAHGGYGFQSPSINAFTGFKINGRNTTFTMQYKV